MKSNDLEIELKKPYSSKELEKPKPYKERWFDRFLFWVKPEENFEGFEFKFTWKF